jgi:hypothetical protein
MFMAFLSFGGFPPGNTPTVAADSGLLPGITGSKYFDTNKAEVEVTVTGHHMGLLCRDNPSTPTLWRTAHMQMLARTLYTTLESQQSYLVGEAPHLIYIVLRIPFPLKQPPRPRGPENLWGKCLFGA